MHSKAVMSSGTVRTPEHLDGSRVLDVGVEWRGVASEWSCVGVVVTVKDCFGLPGEGALYRRFGLPGEGALLHAEPTILLQKVVINVEYSHS